jgi:hypothetical protein
MAVAISILLLESVREDEPACAGRPGMLPACCSLGKIIASSLSRERGSGRLHVNSGCLRPRLGDPNEYRIYRRIAEAQEKYPASL